MMTPGPPRTQEADAACGRGTRSPPRRSACTCQASRRGSNPRAWRGHAPRKLGKGWPEHNPIARNAPAISPRAAEKTFALLLLLLRFSAHETSPAAPDNGRKAPPRLAKPHHVCALSQAQSRPGVAHVRRLRARREPAAGRRSCAAPAEARRRLQARQRGLDALGRRLTGLSRGKTNPAKQPLGQPIGSICPVCPRPVRRKLAQTLRGGRRWRGRCASAKRAPSPTGLVMLRRSAGVDGAARR